MIFSTGSALVIVSIEPASDQYNCTFIGVEGIVTHLGSASDLDPPQAEVSATCGTEV